VASGAGRRRTDRGSTLPLQIFLGLILLVLVAVVVDASAAYLRRQSLATLAEGAALQAADLGAQGVEMYGGAPQGERLALTESAARAAVADYLGKVGAYRRFPGLRATGVRVDAGDRSVVVVLRSPMELPLGVPGAATSTTVEATGTASVTVDSAQG